ncbi:hypothetical protein B0H10DRAFT_1951223 [Mycena sp. CBHHK59/15]|nr:hypothetical protein B0H10DRAFT_1951223 [Mycena sp. CBHHK59/15]
MIRQRPKMHSQDQDGSQRRKTAPKDERCQRRTCSFTDVGATVAKVEKGDPRGLAPSLYHLGLVSRDTKTKLINEVKSEPGNQTRHENQTIETYIAEQKARPDEDRYIHVSEREGRTAIFGIKHGIIKYIHKVRTLDCDTTFKPVAGKTNLYEIKGWMPEVTLGRVWMKLHDRQSFQFIWEELLSLVKHLTNQRLGFAALHRGGMLLGINADMEAAPLLGMADALLPTIDIPSVAEEVKDAVAVIPTSNSSFSRWKFASPDVHFSGIPDLSHLPREDQDRIHNFMYMETPEDVEEFKIWIRTLPDPNGWWEHKEMHEWLLPSVIQCLSDDVWHVMEATTNLGEAQHAANNAQTGIGMGVVESFIQHALQVFPLYVAHYPPSDTRFSIPGAAEIEIMLQSGNLHNPRNEVSHRYSSRNARCVNATEKAKHARAADEEVQAAEQAVADAQAQLKQIQAESKMIMALTRILIANALLLKVCLVIPLNASTSVDNGIVPDETIPASTLATSEHPTRPDRNCSCSTFLESDAPPKRLKLGPLKGWGVERDGVNMSAVEYTQKHWSEFQDEYPEMLNTILPDDIQVE